MENNSDKPVYKILSQLEGFTYRQAQWILEDAMSKLKDAAQVEKYIPKARHQSQLAFEDKT